MTDFYPDGPLSIEDRVARGRAKRLADPAAYHEFITRDEAPRWAPSDFRSGIRDTLLLRSGVKLENAHPLAVDDPVMPPSLARLADVCMTQVHGVDLSGKPPQERVLRAMGSQSDLPSIVSSVAEGIAQGRQNTLLDKVIRITHPVSVGTYQAEGFVIADITDVPALSYDFEFREPTMVAIAASGEQVKVASASCILIVSRQLIVSDQWDIVTAGARSFAAQSAGKEAAFLFGMIAANPNLADGAPWFDASNSLTGTALDAAGLSAAIKLLRNQQAPGDTVCDADPRTLIVHGDLEPAARVLITDMGMNDELAVVATAHVPEGTWLLQADPRTFPTISRATLSGNGGSSLIVERNTSPEMRRIDGFGMTARHVVGFQPLSRTGIVHCTVA